MAPLQIAWLVNFLAKPLIISWENLEYLGEFLNAAIYEHRNSKGGNLGKVYFWRLQLKNFL